MATKKVFQKKLKYFFFALIFIFLFFFIKNDLKITIPNKNQQIVFYSNQCRKDIKNSYIKALQEAKDSIYLCVYSLSDPLIIQVLEEKMQAGIKLSLILHKSNISKELRNRFPSIQTSDKKIKGLMHQKILVIDDVLVFIGSANMTEESLRMHDNLVVGLYSSDLAYSIQNPNSVPSTFMIEEHLIEWLPLPDHYLACPTLISFINNAKESLQIAMFTWTHPTLTQDVIEAHKRGVKVEILLDQNSSRGSSKKMFKQLKEAGIPIWITQGPQLLHHKLAYIDKKILINGSANWTRAAFKKNQEGFLVIQSLKPQEQKFINKLWQATQIQAKKA